MYFFRSPSHKTYEILSIEITHAESLCAHARVQLAHFAEYHIRTGEIICVNTSASGYQEAHTIFRGEITSIPVGTDVVSIEMLASCAELSLDALYPDRNTDIIKLFCADPSNESALLSECLSAHGHVLHCHMASGEVATSSYIAEIGNALVLSQDHVEQTRIFFKEEAVCEVNLSLECTYNTTSRTILDLAPAMQQQCGGEIASLNEIDFLCFKNSLHDTGYRVLSNTMRACSKKPVEINERRFTKFTYDGSLLIEACSTHQHKEHALCKISIRSPASGKKSATLHYQLHAHKTWMNDFAEFEPFHQYVAGDMVIAHAKAYTCTQEHTSGIVLDESKFQLADISLFFHTPVGKAAITHAINKAAYHMQASARNVCIEFTCDFALISKISLDTSILLQGVCERDILGKVIKLHAYADGQNRYLRVIIASACFNVADIQNIMQCSRVLSTQSDVSSVNDRPFIESISVKNSAISQINDLSEVGGGNSTPQSTSIQIKMRRLNTKEVIYHTVTMQNIHLKTSTQILDQTAQIRR